MISHLAPLVGLGACGLHLTAGSCFVIVLMLLCERSVVVTRCELKLFFLTHDDERAPAAAASGEGGKSVRALRWIDPRTRSTDLDVSVCIAADETPLLSPQWSSTTRPKTLVLRPRHDKITAAQGNKTRVPCAERDELPTCTAQD